MTRRRLDVWELGDISYTAMGAGLQARARTRFPDGALRQVKASGSSRAAARRALFDAIDDKKRLYGSGTIQPRDPATALFEDWLSSPHARDLAPATRAAYERIVRVVLAPTLAHQRVVDLTPPVLQRIVDQVVSERGPASARTVRAVLMNAGNHGVRVHLFAVSPAAQLVLPRRHTEAFQRALTPEDVSELLGRIEARITGTGGGGGRPRTRMVALHRLVMLMGSTGARPGEVLALRWQDVDLDTETVTISGTVVRTPEGGLRRQEQTKTSTSTRRLWLPEEMAVEMRSWMPASERTGYVLASETGGLLEPQNVGTAWRQVRAPGFEHVQLHHLRSTVATVLAADDLRAASAQLGHSSTRITEAHYVDRLQRPDSRARMKIWVRPAFGGHTTGTHSGDTA